MKKDPIVSQDFILLFVFSILVYTAMNALPVIVPLYVTETLGKSTAVSGLMTTVYTISSCISRPFNSLLTDRYGRRILMLLGMIAYGASILLAGMIPLLTVLVICRIIMGVSYSAGSTAANTAAADVIPDSRMTEGIGYFAMSQSMASAFAPALASVLILLVGNQGAFSAISLFAFAAVVVAFSIRYEKKQPALVKAAKQRVGFWEKSALVPALYQFFSLFLISCPMCFITLYIVSRGYSAGVAGTFFTLSSVVIVLIRLFCSKLLLRPGSTRMLLPGYAALFLVCLILPVAGSAALLIGCGLLYGFAHGLIWMTLGSEVVRHAPGEKQGAANAIFYFAFDAAIGIGAAFWGSMIDHVGYRHCFHAIAVCAVVLAAASLFVFSRRRKKWGGSSSV